MSDYKELESFLFAENKEDFLKTLIVGTDSYNFFYLLNAFHKHGITLPPEADTIRKNYLAFKGDRARNLKLRYQLLSYDAAKTDEDRAKIVREINDEYLKYKFDHPQPSNVTTSQFAQAEQKVVDTLDEELISPEKFAQKALEKNNVNDFRQITEKCYRYLDLKKLEAAHLDIFLHYLNTAPQILDFVDLVCKYVERYKKERSSTTNPYNADWFQRSTLQDLKEFLKRDKDLIKNQAFVGSYFTKEFKVSRAMATTISGVDLEERRKKLLQMYKWTQEVLPPLLFDSLSDQLLYEVLQIGIELDQYDRDLFIKFLEKPKTQHSLLNDNVTKQVFGVQKKQYDTYWHGVHQLNVGRWVRDEEMIKTYLERFFLTAENVKPFDDYLRFTFLNEFFVEVKLKQGKHVQNVTESLTADRIQAINSEKDLRLCRTNKSLFGPGEEVKLSLDIKNIQSLRVKVFEINVENYYRKNQCEFSNDTTLDGLTPSEETVLEFKEPPVQKTTKEFKFDLITKRKRGLFVIEFIGNGISSRAIVKKGSLFTHSRISVAGNLMIVLDEEYQLCKGDTTGIWLANRLHKANAEGHIIIPFVDNPRTETAILLHEGFAELTTIRLDAQSYSFTCSYMYQQEAFLVGNLAKILVKPRLALNGSEAALANIKEPVINLTATTNTGIPTTTVFDKIKLENTGEIEIDYNVVPKLQTIRLDVRAKVKTIQGDGKEIDVSHSHTISFNNYENQDKFTSIYLRSTQTNGYEIYVLGKNGEPKPNMVIQLGLKSIYNVSQISAMLTTNKEGSVVLGRLGGITQVTATLRASNDIQGESRTWTIGQNSWVDIPRSIEILEGDTLRLPLPCDLSEVQLLEVVPNQSVLIENLTSSKLKVEGDIIVINGLGEGDYYLHFRALDIVVKIVVYAGKYWNKSEMIITKDGQMINTRNSLLNNTIFFKKAAVDEKNELSLQIFSENPKQTRVHVFLSTFMPTNVNALANELSREVYFPSLTEVNRKPQWTNVFLNNRKLGDEFCYVLERKSQKRYIGNTLERPHLLLKQTYVRDTTTDNEQLDSGGGYQEERRAAAGARQMDRARGELRAGRGGELINNQVDTLLNFLSNPGRLIANLVPDGNGVIKVADVDLNKYSTVVVVALNEYTSISKVVEASKKTLELRDQRMQPKTTKNNFVSYRRNTTTLQAGKSVHFDDFTSTELQIVDSIPKLFELQKELKKLSGSDVDHGERYDIWCFIKEWHKLSLEEKHKKYDKYCCHELNIFVYFKDNEYFESFIIPFIQNKLEKTFVDYFLLNNEEKLQEALQPSVLSKLNTLEKVLLLLYCKKKGNTAEAKAIADWIDNQSKLKHVDTNTFKKYFDTVINAKKPEELLETKKEMARAPPPPPVGSAAPMNAPPQPMGQARYMAQAPMQQQAMMNRAPMARMAQNIQAMSNVVMEREEQLDMLDVQNFSEAPRAIKQAAQNFQLGFVETEKAKEYAERHYYFQKQLNEFVNYIPISSFWADLAIHIAAEGPNGFLSNNFVYAVSNHTELLAVISFMALPFENSTHKYSPDQAGRGITIEAGSVAMVFHKEIKECQAELRNDILITQRYFDPKDRYEKSAEDPSLQVEKNVSEFIISKIYGCQVIVTNCSVVKQEVQVLVEVPEGALPVKTIDYTKSHTIIINSFSTMTIEFFFYFSQAGKFNVSPANVSKNGKVLATHTPHEIEVFSERKQLKMESLNDILMTGSKKDIIEFVKTKNLFDPQLFTFANIYWLLRDKEFYTEFIAVLKTRKIFDAATWSFSILHGDVPTIQEFFKEKLVYDTIAANLNCVQSSLVQVSKVRVLEYFPLVNSRVHMLPGAKSNIFNREFRNQYTQFLLVLIEKATSTSADQLIWVYYMILQDRIDEAIKLFAKIKREDLVKIQDAVLQYDYFAAYLDFYTGFPNFKAAREISEKYLDYPVLSWRKLFIEIANQLAEYDGEELPEDSKDDEASTAKKNAKNATKEETLSIELTGSSLVVNYQNIGQLTVDYFEIDLEILFSRNPFLLQGGDDFSFVKPTHSETVSFETSQVIEKKVLQIPEALTKKNVFILVSSLNKRATTTYFSTKLTVQIVENYGQIKVLDSDNKPLSKVYVKTFARFHDGRTMFYKDGYTDLRGRFDYASLNSGAIDNIQKFSIFVMSDELGSIIKETTPPSKIGKFDDGLKLKSLKHQAWQTNMLELQEKTYQSKMKK